MRRILPCLFVLMSAGGPASPQSVKGTDAMHRYRATADGRDSVFVLPHRFLVAGSMCAFLDSLPLSPQSDFRVDPLMGVLRFERPPDSGRTVTVWYQSLPLKLPLEHIRWTAAAPPKAAADSAKQPTPAGAAVRLAPDLSDNLQKSGSIFRGISLGSDQGMRLQSGLRLQVSGRIAPNVEVVASLTDQNTPIQPEGNTQTLQEIDKVFVEIRAPGLRATLGDYVFEAPPSQFANFGRKLQGAMGTAETERGAVTAFAAASKGQFTTNHFNGQEGNQGPYQLTGGQGQREILVLAGTERIWIDGRTMVRGEDNDYTIEYGTGQITFTRNRLITSDSRITVDFEYSDQKFQKALYGLVGEARPWKDRLTIRAALFTESDDKDNPIDIPLNEATRAVLRAAGDEPDSAVASGARWVGAGQGSYTASDSMGVTVYRYAGRERGDHLVHFSFVGQGKGDYSFQGYDIYRYEGPGRGAYLPVLFLPLAASHQIADASASLALGRGTAADAEVALSRLDRNTYSERDDGDNTGIAWSGGFRADRRAIRLFGAGLGEGAFSAMVRNTGDRFRPLGRTGEIEHGRKWGTAEGSVWGESLSEFHGSYSPHASLSLEGEVGAFERGGFRSARKQFGAVWRGPSAPVFQYRAELLSTSDGAAAKGSWLRQNGSLGTGWKGVQPSLTYEGELRRDDRPDSGRVGFRFDEWAGKIAAGRGAFRVEVEEALRDDRVYRASRLEPNSLARTERIRLEAQSGSAFASSFLFTHRTRDYADPNREDQKADLADAKVHAAPFDRFLDLGVNYRYSSTQVSEMARDTIRVGTGLGNYRYDEGLREFVPDPDGDVLFRTLQTGRFLPVNDLEGELDLRMDASRPWRKARGLRGALSGFQTRSIARVERRDRRRSFGSVNAAAFNPSWGADSTLVSGLVSLNQDVEYTTVRGGLSMRLRLRNDDSENHQLVQEGLVRRVRTRALRVKAAPARSVGFLLEAERQREAKDYTERSRADRDIRLDAATAELSIRPRQELEFALKARARLGTDEAVRPATRAVSVFWSPRVVVAFRARGQWRTEIEIGDVRADGGIKTLPYEMLAGDQPGRTFRLSTLLSYRLTGHVLVTLTYRGRKEPWRKSMVHTGQVEMRAFF